jgi:nucleotide-binding universal stress UspA family protein
LVPGSEAGRIVVGVDGSQSSERALATAFEESSLRGVGLTAIQAWTQPYFDMPGSGASVPDSVVVDSFRGEEMRWLSEQLAGWREKYPDVDLRQVVQQGSPGGVISAASAGAELVVVGSRGRGGFKTLLLGSVSHAVLHHAHCPVMVVRPVHD